MMMMVLLLSFFFCVFCFLFSFLFSSFFISCLFFKVKYPRLVSMSLCQNEYCLTLFKIHVNLIKSFCGIQCRMLEITKNCFVKGPTCFSFFWYARLLWMIWFSVIMHAWTSSLKRAAQASWRLQWEDLRPDSSHSCLLVRASVWPGPVQLCVVD